MAWVMSHLINNQMKSSFLLALLLPVMAWGQSIAEKADQLLTAYVAQKKFSGNVLIAKEGRIVFQKSYGMADRARRQPNTLQTEFRVGSLSKMFTATAILQLEEEGKLSLTDPVAQFVPHFPYGNQIQIRHLLSHTSGIQGAATTTPEPTNLTESVERFRYDSLAFKPGEKFEYNNFNFILLSYIAERASGKKLSQLLQTGIFQPLGMKQTGLDANDRTSAYKSVGYVTNPRTQAWEPETSANVALASGAGALYTTLGDLYKWSQAVSAHTVLNAAAAQKALTPVQAGYGLGWMINQKNGRTGYGHTGSIEGYLAYFMKYPKEDVTIIFLSNYRYANGQQLASDLTAIAFNELYTLPQLRKEVILSAAVLNRYAGDYQLKEGFVVKVSVENNKLYVLAPGEKDKVELSPVNETQFVLKGPEIEMEFLKENEKVQYLFIKMQGGLKLTKIS